MTTRRAEPTRRGCGPGACRQYSRGHDIHFIQLPLVLESPRGWRDGIVGAASGQTVSVHYLASRDAGAEPVLWHHESLTDLAAGDPVRVHEQFGLLDLGARWVCVDIEQGAGPVGRPTSPDLWHGEGPHAVLDVATGTGHRPHSDPTGQSRSNWSVEVERVEPGQAGDAVEVGVRRDDGREAGEDGGGGVDGIPPPGVTPPDEFPRVAQHLDVERVPDDELVDAVELRDRTGPLHPAQAVEEELLPALDAHVDPQTLARSVQHPATGRPKRMLPADGEQQHGGIQEGRSHRPPGPVRYAHPSAPPRPDVSGLTGLPASRRVGAHRQP